MTGVEAHGHRQVQLHLIAALPGALDYRKAFFHLHLHGLTVYLEGPRGRRGVRVLVQFAGHKLLAGPSGDTQAQGEVDRFFRIKIDANLSIIRIGRCLPDRHFRAAHLHCGGGFREESDVQILAIMRVGHALHLRQQARHVARATGRTKPRRSSGCAVIEGILSIGRQRVDVKEPVAGEVHRGEHVVQQRHLGHIEILRVFMQQKHAVVEQHITNRRAGFVEGIGIGQLVFRTESLDAMHGAQAAGDVHARVGDVRPNMIKRLGVRGFTGQHADIRHAGVQVRGAHGVTDRLGLLGHRAMLLGVGRRHHAFALGHVGDAADFQKFPRHVEVQLLARHAVQLHQCQLHLLMARRLPNGFAAVIFRVALEEDLIDVSCVFLRHLQQLVFAGRLIIRDGCLIHVAHIVQLVTMHYELVRLVAHHVFLCPHAGGMRRIQIPVGLLRRGDDVYDRVKLRLELGIIAQLH